MLFRAVQNFVRALVTASFACLLFSCSKSSQPAIQANSANQSQNDGNAAEKTAAAKKSANATAVKLLLE